MICKECKGLKKGTIYCFLKGIYITSIVDDTYCYLVDEETRELNSEGKELLLEESL